MASVFLSYDHDDADRAASIAAAMENAGHTVWWDRNIHGGAEFNNAIEDAVERADVVVVLWSERSVRSAWVRDEAAEGRDQRKLVPVCLDPVRPPMGFRQYQTIDLTKWNGRGVPTAPPELLQAIEMLGEPAARHSGATYASPSPSLSPMRRTSPFFLAGVAGLALMAIALLWWRPWSSAISGPTVSVVANDDSAGSRALASNLLVQLGSLQASNPDELHLVDAESGAEANLTFKAGALGGSPDPRAGLSLIDNRSKTLLWAREFVQPGGNEADLRQQLAYSAGQVLRCTTEALAANHPQLELRTLRLYLNGCADLSNLLSTAGVATATFKTVTEQAPRFKGGWAKLLLAQIEVVMSSDPTKYDSVQQTLRSYITAARKLDSTMTEAYLAESWIQAPRPIIGWMRHTDEAVSRDPDHSQALEMRSLGMRHVGRMREAVADVKRAVQVNPLSPTARESLIVALMDSGAVAAARNELRSAEQLWPGATLLVNLRFMLEYRYGDPKEAKRMMEAGLPSQVPPGAENFILARINPSAANIERATADAREAFKESANGGSFSSYVQVLATFGRTEDAIIQLLTVDPRVAPGVIVPLFRPHMSHVRQDRRFIKIAKRFELIPYWQASGKWPDFCSEPDLSYDCKKEAE